MVDINDSTLDEKYRPNTIRDLVGQPHIQTKMANFVACGRIPHMLFVGQPGVGKTSAAHALARDLYGEHWRANFHEFNASTTRGIDFIRGDIHRLTTVTPVGAAYQIIFLDEADELTFDAQTALRQTMMKFTETTKFILSCNYPHKIIGPIKDRCSVLRFKSLKPETIAEKLKIVCENEQITYDDGVPELIAKFSGGSLRKAIQNIEVYRDHNNFISLAMLQQDMTALESHDVKLLLQKAISGDVNGYESQLFDLYYDGGFCAAEILSGIMTEVNNMQLSPTTKQALILQTAEFDWRISQGSNELLQMRAYLSTLQSIISRR